MLTLRAGTIKRIHVNRQILAANLKHGQNKPAITIQTSKGPITAGDVYALGACRFMQAGVNAAKPLSCGARVWVETRGEVEYK